MPINEPPAYHGNLTEREQREGLAAVYGLAGGTMTPELTYEERIKMRRHLDALDAKEAGGQKEFDLAKPPVPAYSYREFPFLMYNHETHATRAAQNHEQREIMIRQGWSIDPIPMEVPQVQLTVSERIQIEEIDRQLKMSKENLAAERSAENVAQLRAEIAELRALLAATYPQDPNAAGHDQASGEPQPELETAPRKRSK